jgi:hypothetical protein
MIRMGKAHALARSTVGSGPFRASLSKEPKSTGIDLQGGG